MYYPRVLTIQDISCAGQCSLTVALPILSACGVETCVLPTAILSTHTGGLGKPHIRDLTEDMPRIAEHWENADIRFDAISCGYLGTVWPFPAASKSSILPWPITENFMQVSMPALWLQ